MSSTMIKNTGGTELDGLFSPDRIAKLFWRMSEPWHKIAEQHIDSVCNCCKDYFEAVTQLNFTKTGRNRALDDGTLHDGFENDEVVARNYIRDHIIPNLAKAKKKASDELYLLEEDRRDWPKNLDKRFLVDQKTHRQRTEFHYTSRVLRGRLKGDNPSTLDPEILAEQRGLSRQQNYQDHVAEEFLSAMKSHYLIARDIFISNVVTQVVERHFMRKIQDLIPNDLDDAGIQDLLKEDEKSARKKARTRDEKRRLDIALEAVKRFQIEQEQED
ncbi:hypothetical protein CaCOL14_012546 [Colletotrichum acutatum]